MVVEGPVAESLQVRSAPTDYAMISRRISAVAQRVAAQGIVEVFVTLVWLLDEVLQQVHGALWTKGLLRLLLGQAIVAVVAAGLIVQFFIADSVAQVDRSFPFCLLTQGTPTVAPIPATLRGVQCHVTLAVAQIHVQNQFEVNEIIGDA